MGGVKIAEPINGGAGGSDRLSDRKTVVYS